MTKLEALKAKIEDLKIRENQVASGEHIIKSLSGLYQIAQVSVKEKVVTNNLLFFQELLKEVEQKITNNQGGEEIAKALNKLSSKIDDKTNSDLVEQVKNLVKHIEKLESKKYFDQNQFDKVFTDSIGAIKNVLAGNTEIPSNTSYKRNNDGNIIRVIETYDKFTLTHAWSWDAQGNLSNVLTTKKDA